MVLGRVEELLTPFSLLSFTGLDVNKDLSISGVWQESGMLTAVVPSARTLLRVLKWFQSLAIRVHPPSVPT